LLGLLWLARVALDVLLAATLPHPFLLLICVGDVILFTLCLAGCIELGFGKRVVRLSRSQWRIVFNATLVLGGFYVMIKNYGELLNMPSLSGEGGLLQILLDFLPYLLFAVPVILLEHERKKAGEN